MNLYFTYRRTFETRGNRYDISYYNDKIFADYKEAGLTNMTDGSRFIPDNRITKEVIPGVKSLRVAGVLEYDANLDVEVLKRDFLTTTGNFLPEIKTAEEMKTWIRENTDLIEENEGKFLIAEATEDGIDGPTEARYVEIV